MWLMPLGMYSGKSYRISLGESFSDGQLMRDFLVFVLMLFAFLAPLMPSEAQIPRRANRADDESRQEAERLWELAIAAKGGRERLYSVRNFVVSSKSRF